MVNPWELGKKEQSWKWEKRRQRGKHIYWHPWAVTGLINGGRNLFLVKKVLLGCRESPGADPELIAFDLNKLSNLHESVMLHRKNRESRKVKKWETRKVCSVWLIFAKQVTQNSHNTWKLSNPSLYGRWGSAKVGSSTFQAKSYICTHL